MSLSSVVLRPYCDSSVSLDRQSARVCFMAGYIGKECSVLLEKRSWTNTAKQ
jgi:hypothetical protein